MKTYKIYGKEGQFERLSKNMIIKSGDFLTHKSNPWSSDNERYGCIPVYDSEVGQEVSSMENHEFYRKVSK